MAQVVYSLWTLILRPQRNMKLWDRHTHFTDGKDRSAETNSAVVTQKESCSAESNQWCEKVQHRSPASSEHVAEARLSWLLTPPGER